MPKEIESAGLSNNFQKATRSKNNGTTNNKAATTEKLIVLGNFRIMNGSLIPVMLRFVWTFNRNTDIICLFFGKLCQFDADLFQMEACNFFI